jgi:glycosyltransferase involved in cell wall biosynthesis
VKIAVVTNCVPFLRGGAEILADALVARLAEHGHQAALIRIPFEWRPPERILEQILACRLMRVPEVDRIIAFKFPAYYIPHPNKVFWILHQFRQAYDFWGTEFQDLPDSPAGRAIREAIIASDNLYLREGTRVFTNSQVTAGRLMRFNGIAAEVLEPPLLNENDFRCESYGDYIFSPGRINSTKRQRLLLEAMKHTKSNVRLILAGKPEDPADSLSFRKWIAQHDLEQRVTLLDRFITEEEKVDLFANALACAYIPYDEDSYGYVTLEAFLSAKPVLTCTDTGGVRDFVAEASGGPVVEPEQKSIAAAMDLLFSDPQQTRKTGESARDFAKKRNINWNRVIATLVK